MRRIAKAFSSQIKSIGYEIAPSNTLQSRLLSGSFILLSASVLVGVMNLLYNLVVAHMLGPEGFSHATVVYTLLIVSSAVTLSVQVVCADKPGLLASLSASFNQLGVNISQANCRSLDDNRAINTFQFTVTDLEQLKTVIRTLQRINGVYSVQRM